MITKFLLKQFRFALLNKDEERIADYEKKILADGATQAEIDSEKRWAATAYPLIDEALELRAQGYFTESLKFDDLEKRANKIGMPLPAFLRNLMQSAAAIEMEKAQKRKANARPYTKNDLNNRTITFLLADIRWKASWGKTGKSEVKALLKEIQERFPNSVNQAEHNIEIGKKISQAKNEAKQCGLAGKNSSAFEVLYKKWNTALGEEVANLKSQMQEPYNVGLAIRERNSINTQITDLPKIEAEPFIVDSEMTTKDQTLEYSKIHPNFIATLPPAKKWTVLIDETGSDFSVAAQNKSDSRRGRIVAVVIPDYCELPELPATYHSVNKSFETIQKVVDTITQSPCGVLGISLNALHSLNGELWYVGVETLLDTILRLLPIDGKTSVTVHVEQRAQFTPEMSTFLETTCSSCRNRLSRTYPNRAAQIELSGDFIKKSDHPLIGYADTVAFCWGGSSVASLLKSSGWVNSCLLDSKPEQLCIAIDSLQRQTPLNEQEWDDLINRREAGSPNSLAYALLTMQGEEASKDESLWNRYLEHVQKHLYSKAINLYALGNQIAWLKKWIPAEANFSPSMRLIWLTTQLAQANHLGQTDMITRYQKEFEDLCTLIYPEDAPLTCLTCLHVAVAYMNDFNFKTAYDVVKQWENKDEAIPGRRYYGQLLSTVGQLNAFIGNPEEAVTYCNRAIEKFEKLTDADQMKGEINQTSSYKVIAMMDSTPVPENMTAEMEKYLGRTLAEAADQFAVSNDADEKYMHHVFLRYLVHVNTPELKSIIDNYLSHKTEWKTEYGHPWEMIAYYRALLQTDDAARNAYLDQAYKQVAQTNDGTLKVIACVILGGLYYYDSSRKEELATLTQQVINTMPYLGEARVATLKKQLETPVEPLALAKAVLPFNFR